MTKKATKKSSTPKAPRAKKPARARQVHVYSHLGKDTADLSPQAAAIVQAIKAAGGTIHRPDLIKALKTALTSEQSASRVLSYYKKPLITGKYIKVEKIDKASPAPTQAPTPSPAPASEPPIVAPSVPSAPAET